MMKLNTGLSNGCTASFAQAAASVIMLRDGACGLEIYLMKRNALSNAFAGAYVFPGGKVDPPDAMLDAQTFLDRAATELQLTLNEPGLDLASNAGLYVTAIREVFEECGVLFACDATLDDVSRAAACLQRGEAFNTMLHTLNARLQVSSLVPWSRWITPVTPSLSSKRFDTRFFVAAIPAGQTAIHDNHEATASVWLTPRAALRQYEDSHMLLAPPQIMTLAHLSRYATVQETLSEARRRKPPTIQPEPIEHPDGRIVCYPGDEQHPVKERAMPGPTRLYHRSERFVPADGFAALFE